MSEAPTPPDPAEQRTCEKQEDEDSEEEMEERHPNAEDEEVDENVQINESTVGFSETDLKTCVKVLSLLNYRKKLLATKKLKKFFTLGQALFAPLDPEEKRKRRRERKKQKKMDKLRHDIEISHRTEMKKKKVEEKKTVIERLPENLKGKKRTFSLLPRGHKPKMPPMVELKDMLVPNSEFKQIEFEDVEMETISEGTRPEAVNSSSASSSSTTTTSDPTPQPSASASSADPSSSTSPPTTELKLGKKCHICKKKFSVLHHFYDALCPDCANFNFDKRNQSCDLKGKVALVTGGRVKIGYEIVLKLLRWGAVVVVTSRFPKDAALRYQQEKDFDQFKDNLKIYGLDMRHIPSVVEFCEFMNKNYDRLDIIINNAAQTIRRPPVFYSHLMEKEAKAIADLPEQVRQILPSDFEMKLQALPDLVKSIPGASVKAIEHSPAASSSATTVVPTEGGETSLSLTNPNISVSAALTQVPLIPGDEKADPKLFPPNVLDVNGEQVDLRNKNSWKMQLTDVPLLEFMEVQTINATAPFIINSRLKDLMTKDPTCDKWIINVSSMEGQFYKPYKNTEHPHTNMAKASLNMMTRTSGAFYAKDRIYMNSVDTGWVTEEKPKNFQVKTTVPLDEIDGAARVLDPIVLGVKAGKNIHSMFLKDYKIVHW